MKIIVATILTFSTIASSCQVKWSNASDWTLYGYQGNKMFSIPSDSLSSLESLKLSQDSVLSFISSAYNLKPAGQISWMGGYIVSCRINGKLRKVEFSNYGGFFYDDETHSYFQIPTDKVDDWLSYLQQSLLAIAHRHSSANRKIPQRK